MLILLLISTCSIWHCDTPLDVARLHDMTCEHLALRLDESSIQPTVEWILISPLSWETNGRQGTYPILGKSGADVTSLISGYTSRNMLCQMRFQHLIHPRSINDVLRVDHGSLRDREPAYWHHMNPKAL